MSIEALTVVLNHSQAKGTEKLVLIGIANHHGEQGAWPSVATLARYSNMSERRVQQVIKTLEQSGELTIEMGKGAGVGKYKTNLYKILVTCPKDCSGFPQHSQTKPASPLASQTKPASLQDETRFALEVKPAMTKPIEEPVKEPESKNDSYKPSKQLVNELSEKYPGLDLKECWESMMDYCAANGKSYRDWDAAYRNWVRKEWQWSDKGKQQANQKDTRAYLDKSASHTQELLAEYAEAESNAAPPPKCKHDKTLALCPICVKDL